MYIFGHREIIQIVEYECFSSNWSNISGLGKVLRTEPSLKSCHRSCEPIPLLSLNLFTGMPFFGKICLDLDFQFPLEACFRCKKRFFGILIQYFFHKILECSRYVFVVFNIRSCSVPKLCKILFF